MLPYLIIIDDGKSMLLYSHMYHVHSSTMNYVSCVWIDVHIQIRQKYLLCSFGVGVHMYTDTYTTSTIIK